MCVDEYMAVEEMADLYRDMQLLMCLMTCCATIPC